jgi:hypothetical protein
MEAVIDGSASIDPDQDRQPNRRLTPDEHECARRILETARAEMNNVAAGDRELLFALRRYILNRLIHDERGTPMQRRKLKQKKVAEQNGQCAICRNPLPKRNSVLDRIVAVDGYTEANTRVLCPECDGSVQAERKFS